MKSRIMLLSNTTLKSLPYKYDIIAGNVVFSIYSESLLPSGLGSAAVAWHSPNYVQVMKVASVAAQVEVDLVPKFLLNQK